MKVVMFIYGLLIIAGTLFVFNIRDRGECLKWELRMHTYFIGDIQLDRGYRSHCLQWERP